MQWFEYIADLCCGRQGGEQITHWTDRAGFCDRQSSEHVSVRGMAADAWGVC